MNIPRYKIQEKMIEKKCCFEGCNEVFQGTGKSKYCEEHRLRKYRKIIDKDKIEQQLNQIKEFNVNVTINHKYSSPTELDMKCECCGGDFSITLFPETYIYPRYCKEHRNEFKRLMYMKQHGIIKEIPRAEVVIEEDLVVGLDIDFIKEMTRDINYNIES